MSSRRGILGSLHELPTDVKRFKSSFVMICGHLSSFFILFSPGMLVLTCSERSSLHVFGFRRPKPLVSQESAELESGRTRPEGCALRVVLECVIRPSPILNWTSSARYAVGLWGRSLPRVSSKGPSPVVRDGWGLSCKRNNFSH